MKRRISPPCKRCGERVRLSAKNFALIYLNKDVSIPLCRKCVEYFRSLPDDEEKNRKIKELI